ncbi:MAG: sialidase family protein, partial [Bacteroidota bacterium]
MITTPDGYDNFDVGINNAEQHISANPNNPLQMVFGVNGSGTPWRHTEDAGLTWAISTPLGSNSGDPWSAYDSLGNVYVQWLSGSNNPVFRSTNNGVTWGPGVTSAIGGDRNTMAVDQTTGPYGGYLYAGAWSPNCTFARSTNNGASFTVTLTTPNTTPGNMIAVGANVLGGQDVQGGCVYYVSITGTNPVPSTFNFFRSTNGGATFDPMSSLTVAGYVGTINTANRLVINNARTRPYPMIAADNSNGPYRGRLYLVYASNEPVGNGNKPDIFIQYSTDQGATWTPRSQRVNDNANPETTNEWFPFIWCDKNTGRLYVKWYDMRNDATNQRAWVYGTYSDNGGVTFAPNQKLSNADMPYPGIPCSPNTNCYRGDYDGIVAVGDVAMAVWTDFRNTTYQNMLSF